MSLAFDSKTEINFMRIGWSFAIVGLCLINVRSLAEEGKIDDDDDKESENVDSCRQILFRSFRIYYYFSRGWARCLDELI